MEQPDHRSERRGKRDRRPQQERVQHATPTRRTTSSARCASTAKESGAQPPARDSSPLPTRPSARGSARASSCNVSPTMQPATRSSADSSRMRSPVAGPSVAGPSAERTAARNIAPVAIAVIAFALVIVGLTCTMRSCSAKNETAPGASATAAQTTSTVSFVAVGDNLPETVLAEYAWAQGGDHYDFRPIYEFVEPAIAAADIAYVKQEVHLDDSIGPHGYPSFNAPESLADDLISVGFDVIGSASNHIYDWGYFGACARNREVWNSKNVVFAGSNLNAEEAETIATFEKGGIRFAFLDYTYGVNGYSPSDLDWWEVNFISEDRLKRDVARAHELADVVIVAMHWGTENFTEIDDYQAEYAQLLADLNVDLVLGSHPHVIGPVEWLTGADGHRTLVAYSLGNFLSRHEAPDAHNELEGMLSCDFVRQGSTVTIENATWTPLVNHTDWENYYFRVIPLGSYTNELAANGVAMSQLDNAVEWVRATSREIVGDQIAFAD